MAAASTNDNRPASPPGPWRRIPAQCNPMVSPSQQVVTDAKENGRNFVEYLTEREDRITFIHCTPGRLEKFCNNIWEHGSTSLSYTGGEGALRDNFGFCGLPHINKKQELEMLLRDLAVLADRSGIMHNLKNYRNIDDSWWSKEQVPTRGMPSAALPERKEPNQPSGSLQLTYKVLMEQQADDQARRENEFEDYRRTCSPPRRGQRSASPSPNLQDSQKA